jgi:hypothetical protein
MTESQQAAFARATLMLAEALNSDWWRQPPESPYTDFPPWPGRDEVGVIIPGVADLLTPDVVGWFRSRGWLAGRFRDDVIAAPLVEVAPPEVVLPRHPGRERGGHPRTRADARR